MIITTRHKIGVPLVIMLAAMAVFSLRWGFASLDLWRATELIAQLQVAEYSVDSKIPLLERGLRHLDHAQQLGGDNPDIFDKRGQFYYWQAMNLADAGEERGVLLEQAAEQYREALKMRPLWPYFWANLAVAKAEWGIFDPEFRKAIKRTVETGPWEPRVQMMLIRVDFIEQQRLDRRSRERINEMLERAMQIQPRNVLALASDLGQLPRVCGMIEQEKRNWQCAGIQ
ncbi:MAG: hypothetical protein ACI9H8_000362 [Lysobacterales bacterium]|jgi:hypothetical protein